MSEACVFLDTPAQTIVVQTDPQAQGTVIEHEGWHIAVDPKALNQIFAADATKRIVSPFSYLFLQYQKSRPKHTLYVLLAEENIFIVTFDEDLPVYWKIVPLESNKDIEKVIEAALKEFYRQEKTYFIEKVVIYRFSTLAVVLADEIENSLFVETEVHDKEPDEYCNEKGIEQFAIVPTIEKKEKSFIERNRFAIGLFILVLLGLLAVQMYLRYKTEKMNEKSADLISRQVRMANATNAYTTKILKAKKVDPIIADIKESNAAVVARMKSVFDLIPDDAYLVSASFTKEQVLLEGVALSRASIQKALGNKAQGSLKGLQLTRAKRGYGFKIAYGEKLDEVH